MRSDIFPIGLKLDGKLCLVVGAGTEAERRALALSAAGAAVRVVSELPTEELERLAADGAISLARRGFDEADLEGVWLAVYTDMEPHMAARIAKRADAARVFFSAIDRPAESSYSHLALAKSGPVTAAISTDGRVPALASKLRDELERVFEEAALGEFAEEIALLRERTRGADRRAVLGAALRGVRFVGRLVLEPRSDEEDATPGGNAGRPRRFR